MYASVSGKLVATSAAVLAALVVGGLPPGQHAPTAQTPGPVARPWSCLAAVASGLGTPRVDSACDSTARRSSVHLAPPSRARIAAIAVPGPPSSLTASVSGGTVALSWTAPTTGDPPGSYVLEAGSASGRIDLANTDTGSTSTALTATAVPAGTYYVRVRARSASGTSAPSNEIVVTVQGDGGCAASPGAPGPLSAVVNGSSLTLTWQAPSGGCSATAYVIEAGSAPGLSNLAAFSTGSAATSFGASGIGSGTYYVRVRSTNAAGTSAASNEVQFSVGARPCAGPPEPPTRITSTVSGTTVVISWDERFDTPLSYIIEAGSSPGLSNLVVSDTGNSNTTLTASAAAGTYYVRLRARNNCGTGAASTEITVVVGGAPSDNVSILVADLPGQRLVSMTDMNGANWQTGPAGSGRSFNNPWHVSMDSRGRIYVADRDNSRIVRMDDLAGNGWTTFGFANRLSTSACDPGQPIGCVVSVAVDPAGRIYVTAAGRLVRIDDMTGAGFTSFVGINSGGSGSFINPKVVTFDRQGRIYVTDTDRHRIDRFDDMQGTGWTTFGSQGNGVGQFERPEGLAIDALGRIYVTDNENSRIVRINDMTGAGWVTFGSLGSAYGSPGPTGPARLPAVGQFDVPHDIAVSASMKIYIADTGNGRVVRIDDMTGAGWTTFGHRTTQPNGCIGTCQLPGVFEFIAIKGIWVTARP